MKKNQLHFMKKLQRTLNTVINNSKKEISESDAKDKIKNLERKVDDLQNQVKKILYTIGR
jgi:peptidoglycan hydrolase CwlO-like protein